MSSIIGIQASNVDEVNSDKTSCRSHAWTVTFSAATFFFYQFMLINIFNALNEPMLKEFHLSASELSHISTSYFYSSMLSLLPAGIVLDRFSTRKVIITAMSISVLTTFMFGFAPTPAFATFARFIAGISGAFCFLSSIRIASRWFPPHRMALVIGLVVSFAMVGGIIAQTPLTLLAQHVGWRQAVEVLACSGLLMLIMIYFNVNDYPTTSLHEQDVNKASLNQFLQLLIQTLKNKQNWLSGLYISLLNLPVFLLGAMWGTLYLTQIHGITRAQSTYVTSMIFVGMIFGSPFMGWLSDQMGYRKIPMMIFAVLSLIPIVLIIYIPNWSLVGLMVLFFTIGFLISSQVLGYPLIAESNSPELTGTAEGIASTIMIAGGLSQLLFAKIMEINWSHTVIAGVPLYSLQNFNGALLIIPTAFMLALVASFFLNETRCTAMIGTN